jgi:hypothetical protein
MSVTTVSLQDSLHGAGRVGARKSSSTAGEVIAWPIEGSWHGDGFDDARAFAREMEAPMTRWIVPIAIAVSILMLGQMLVLGFLTWSAIPAAAESKVDAAARQRHDLPPAPPLERIPRRPPRYR